MGIRTFFSLLPIFTAFSLKAQQAEPIEFSESLHDFGIISESDGPVIHEFRFLNKGEDTVRITNVKASCGCTTPSWSTDPIAPGGAGMVQARFDPHNRPGPFNKNLSVEFKEGTEPVRLYIRGEVKPATGSPSEELTNKMGGIRLRYKTLNMGKVYTLDTPTVKSFDIYNDSDTTITFLPNIEKPAHVEVSFDPPSLKPGQLGDMEIHYDAAKKNSLGFSSDNITFYTDEPEGSQRKILNLYATIEEYFPPMTEEEVRLAPHLTVKEPMYDFGRIKQNDMVKTTYTVINSGQSELNIRQLSGNCACIRAKINKNKLKPGEEAEVDVTFDSDGRLGNQQKSITLYTNDPIAPAQRITIRGYIE